MVSVRTKIPNGAQRRAADFTEFEWQEEVRNRRRRDKATDAAVLRETDPAAENALRAVPAHAEIVRLAPRSKAVLGYTLSRRPAGSERREFQFRVFRATELKHLAEWRLGAGIALRGDAWARAIASVTEPNVASLWIRHFCPSLSMNEISAAIDEAGRLGVRFSAQELGDLVGLTIVERENLDIRSIRPAGMTGRDFARYARERAKEHTRKRDEARRRAAGVKPRRRGDAASEEAARLGISRSALFKRKRKARSKAVHSKLPHDSEFKYSTVPSAPPQITPPAWLIRLFATKVPIPVNDPGAPPEAIRLGALVASHAAALRAVRAAA